MQKLMQGPCIAMLCLVACPSFLGSNSLCEIAASLLCSGLSENWNFFALIIWMWCNQLRTRIICIIHFLNLLFKSISTLKDRLRNWLTCRVLRVLLYYCNTAAAANIVVLMQYNNREKRNVLVVDFRPKQKGIKESDKRAIERRRLKSWWPGWLY